jgi:carbon-monoxide dehydrogenase small subunit
MRLSLEINGKPISAEIAPRTHLADFLREELLLTGTHLGCEHGVCGACTILLDGAPARACLASAAACEGTQIRTIEGLDDDPVMIRLRTAFSRAHALQCGYCTPGMLVTAWDILRRLPDADDDRVRLELSGNLCRCTGYNGIVRAIRAVLDERLNLAVAAPALLPRVHFDLPSAVAAPAAGRTTGQAGMSFKVAFDLPADIVWPALRDPALIASCIPGAALGELEGNHLTGEMVISLGPIRARFLGAADLEYHETRYSGRMRGEGRDRGSNTRLAGTAAFDLRNDGAGSVLTMQIEYTLQGPLTQLARSTIIEAVAGDLAQAVGENLQARLRGETNTTMKRSGAGFFARVLWRSLWRRLFARRR